MYANKSGELRDLAVFLVTQAGLTTPDKKSMDCGNWVKH